MPPDHPSTAASICIGCGFCCDGILHGHTDLDRSEEVTARSLGLPVHRLGEQLIFRQPCPKFSGGICSIYAQRPEPCRGYRCKLRKEVDEDGVSATDAREKIETAKVLIAKVKELGAWRDTPDERATAWRELEDGLAASEGAECLRIAKTVLALAALDAFLDRWFRRDKPAPGGAKTS